MAHNLATLGGAVMMAYQDESPWHRLGQTLPAGANVEQALAAAHLDWRVQLAPAFRQAPSFDGPPTYIQIPDRRVVEREDGQYLATVGPQFTPLQNADAFGVLSDVCRDFGVTIATAGGLGHGERVWMLARMQEQIEVTAGDHVNGYFLILNGHDGSTSYSARPTPIRVVCQNTLTMALGAKGTDLVRIRHSSSAETRLKEARRIVTTMIQAMKTTGDTFRTLAERTWTPADVARYIEAVIPTPADGIVTDAMKQRRRDIGALVWCGKGAEMAGADGHGATAWAAYNAVTEYFDHVRPAQAKSDAGKANANESALFGSNFVVKSRALAVARQLVAA